MIILETDRLLFRDHEAGDLDSFCAMQADPEVRRYVGGQPHSRASAERRFFDLYLQPAPHRMALFATVYKPSQQYIGYCGVYERFVESKSVPGEGVLGFYLARPYWNQGLATEAGQAFVRFGFAELGLKKIFAGVEIGNAASIRVLEKLGFRRFRTGDVGEHRSFHGYELSAGDVAGLHGFSGTDRPGGTVLVNREMVERPAGRSMLTR